MFTVAQRDAFRERMIELAQADERIIGGAVVGSLAIGAGDRFSDVDLTFAVTDAVPIVLDVWTRLLVERFDAVPLVDLERPPTIYRVFLLPDALQFDLSMTPSERFRPAGPKFRLLFGLTATRKRGHAETASLPRQAARCRRLRGIAGATSPWLRKNRPEWR